MLPANGGQLIDGFRAENGLIHDCYPGVLAAPAEQHPRPFEIIFETPALAPLVAQRAAAVTALQAVLDNYRRVLATDAAI